MALTITRDPGVWVDRARAYTVVIDDVERGKVGHGETLTFYLEPGAPVFG